jgi:predicted RNase H-related nuclease YkuK (DUF458 family)
MSKAVYKPDIYSYIEYRIRSFIPDIKNWFFKNLNVYKRAGEKPVMYIGTDSAYTKGRTVYAIAIVFHAKGCGGNYIFKTFKVNRRLPLFEKIYTEVHASILAAEELRCLDIYPDLSDLVVHIDANSDGKSLSSKYYHGALGMVKGCGFGVEGKPFAFAATSIADRHSRI